ncbi:MAG: response regulator [Candidatus Omnitrophica bacterium]|jgi:CheY-like chemotaxis protein|nr:response regulator [Candidatus Omnitrophota bacterium]MDD5080499.1 response regulator [Candidatus Omnitrophota bacterium]MDD5441068.1 response regulator [Candidatus Omnitrophota bacterium]
MDIKKILFVDDQADFLLLMSKRIESWGYEVVTAENAQDALSQMKMNRFDALVLDYNMPDMDGVSLLREIRKINRRVPAIVFTSQVTFKAIEDGKNLNIAAFIPKESSINDTERDLKTAIDLIAL